MTRFDEAISGIDAANSADPNRALAAARRSRLSLPTGGA